MQHISLCLACSVELFRPVHVQLPAVIAFEEPALFQVDLMAECREIAETEYMSAAALIPHGWSICCSEYSSLITDIGQLNLHAKVQKQICPDPCSVMLF